MSKELEDTKENYILLKKELKKATTIQQILDLCEEYEYEVDFIYEDYTVEELRDLIILFLNSEIGNIKQDIENEEETERQQEEKSKYINENAYYSSLYGIPNR